MLLHNSCLTVLQIVYRFSKVRQSEWLLAYGISLSISFCYHMDIYCPSMFHVDDLHVLVVEEQTQKSRLRNFVPCHICHKLNWIELNWIEYIDYWVTPSLCAMCLMSSGRSIHHQLNAEILRVGRTVPQCPLHLLQPDHNNLALPIVLSQSV